MIDHVLACPTSHVDKLIEPASALPVLDFTLDALARHRFSRIDRER